MSNQQNPFSPLTGEIRPAARKQMELAILCGRLNCALSGSDIWDSIPCEGEVPTVEEVIAWAVLEVMRRTVQEAAEDLPELQIVPDLLEE